MNTFNTTPNCSSGDEEIVQTDGFISDQEREIILIITCTGLYGLVAVVGILTNVVNILVFWKMGFKESMNISLFSLAVADLCSLLPYLWIVICYVPPFYKLDLTFLLVDMTYLSAGWPHIYFVRVGNFITLFITVERFLCISMPLKVKSIITVRRVKFVCFAMFVVLLIPILPIYFAKIFAWIPFPGINRTLLGLVFSKNGEQIESITVSINNVVLPFVSFVMISIFTAGLVIKLHENAKWKGKNLSKETKPEKTKENKVAKMMIVVSTIFVLCYFPNLISFGVMAAIPAYNVVGKYRNIWMLCTAYFSLLEAVNSSVNLFVYYRMSSKYKLVFDTLLSRKRQTV